MRQFRSLGAGGAVLLLCLGVAALMTCGKGNPVDGRSNFGTVTDIEGNVYRTVRIGKQVWMMENLRVTKYNDGTAIPHVADSAAWIDLATPGYCRYNNETHADTIKKWGALYNWYVIAPTNPKQIAPAGWRVPADSDWTILVTHLIASGYNHDSTRKGNKIAKSMAVTTDWMNSSNTGAIGNVLGNNNRSAFSALPVGYRNNDGIFKFRSFYCSWWSSTELVESLAWFRGLHSENEYLFKYKNFKTCGLSLRLVRDY